MPASQNKMLLSAQDRLRETDVVLSPMQNNAKAATLPAASEGRRTVMALVSASIISLVIWGLVVVLHVQ
jgi:hypothetical protein